MVFTRMNGNCRRPWRFFVASILCCVCGCRLQEQIESVRAPAVETRFTANPLLEACNHQLMATPAGVPQMKLGLAMQSSVEPAQVHFAGRLGTALIREMQLSSGAFSVQPLATLSTQSVIPGIERRDGPGIVTVNFQNPSVNGWPESASRESASDAPPNPVHEPLVDQILVVRVLEYRPYFPMLATLEITIRNSQTQEAISSTTASWRSDTQGLVEPRPRRLWRHKWFGEAQPTDPSPGHNSPEALTREIAVDVSAWYYVALNPVIP